MFRVFNTLNVWLVSVSLPRKTFVSFALVYLRCKYYRDKTLRLAFSHVLSLSLLNIIARREISVCVLLSVFFRVVVVVAFS